MNSGKKAHTMMTPDLSVVIPAYNEEACLGSLLDELAPVLQKLSVRSEILVVDDGSTDCTAQVILEKKRDYPHLHLIRLAKNCGQSAAFAAGFRAARGIWILTLDADGQNPPSEIAKLWDHRNDADLIVGWRQQRKDPWTKRWISRIANPCRRWLCQDGVHDTGCSLKLFRATALHSIPLYRGMHRFFPALFCIAGFHVVEVPVSHAPRIGGKSKYHLLNRSLSPLYDLFVVYWMRKRWIRYEVLPGQDAS